MDTRLSMLQRTALGCASWLCIGVALCFSGAALAAQGAASAEVEHDPKQRVFTITVGPIPVHAGGGHNHHMGSESFAVPIPVEGWLRSYEVELTDGAGRPLPRAMLHHLNLLAPGERELFTPIMRRVGAAGQETGRVAAPPGIGYPLQRGDTLLITVMLHDPTGVRVETAAARVRMRYAPATTRAPMLSVYPFYMDVLMRPGARSFDLPPGRTEKSWEGRPAVAGRILGMGGHLHKHAVLLRFEDVTAGRVIWEARPQVDAEGNVVAMPVRNLVWRLGVPLRTEHDYRLTAIYDNPTGHTIPGGGMGALGGIFVPTRRASLPPADRSDPVYALDRRITIEGIHDDLARAAGEAHGHH